MINMFGYQSKALYFLKYLSMKSDTLFNVMELVSQLKDKAIPITVPFCITKTVLFINNQHREQNIPENNTSHGSSSSSDNSSSEE